MNARKPEKHIFLLLVLIEHHNNTKTQKLLSNLQNVGNLRPVFDKFGKGYICTEQSVMRDD